MDRSNRLFEDSDLMIPSNTYLNRKMIKLIKHYFDLDQVNALYGAFYHQKGVDFVRAVLERQRISLGVTSESLSHIPSEGGCVIVANRPYGILDGLLMIDMVCRVRQDVRFMGNMLLSYIEPLRDFFMADGQSDLPSSGFENNNYSNVRRSLEFVQNGGCMIVFPSANVSTHQTMFGHTQDGDWSDSMIKFVRNCRVPVVPVFIEGQNSKLYHWTNKIHSAMASAMLIKEFFRIQDVEVNVRVANPIPVALQERMVSIDVFKHFVRANVYLLKQRDSAKLPDSRENNMDQQSEHVGLSEEKFQALLSKISSGFQISNAGLDLYIMRSSDVCDIDEFIPSSSQKDASIGRYCVIILDKQMRTIVLAYHLILGQEVVESGYGFDKLCSFREFEFSRKFYNLLSKSIEVSAIYTNSRYTQRSDVLKLFWGGLLNVVKRNDWCEYLIGVQSITNDYPVASQMLMVSYLQNMLLDEEFSKFVVPRHSAVIRAIDYDFEKVITLTSHHMSVAMIDKLLSDLVANDMDQGHLPLMLKRYIALGGRVASISRVQSTGLVDMLLVIRIEK